MKSMTWSNSEINSRFSSCQSLSEVISTIEKDCAGRGEVVCEINVNGLALTEEQEVRFAKSELAEINNLTVKVSALGDLLEDSMVALWQYIPEMIRISLITAEQFRGDEIEKGCRGLNSIIQGSSWLVDMFTQLRSNRIVSLKNLSEEQWSSAERLLLDVTKQLSVALERKDYVLLADILEYDWVTVLQDWLELLRQGQTDNGLLRETSSNSLD
jgi:hypothetical protein